MLTCRLCKRSLPLTEFWADKSKANGKRSVCKKCDAARAKAWQHNNAEHMRAYRREWQQSNPERTSAARKRSREKRRAVWLVKTVRGRAKEKGVPFDLDAHVEEIQALIDAGVCQMTGLPFSLAGERDWDSPSLDRIVPAAGYVWGNVRVICHGMNCAMGSWGEEKLREFVTAWLNKR